MHSIPFHSFHFPARVKTVFLKNTAINQNFKTGKYFQNGDPRRPTVINQKPN